MNSQVILLEDGWKRLKEGGVQKIEKILEDMQDGVYKTKISTDEYSALYTCAAPHPHERMHRARGLASHAPPAPGAATGGRIVPDRR